MRMVKFGQKTNFKVMTQCLIIRIRVLILTHVALNEANHWTTSVLRLYIRHIRLKTVKQVFYIFTSDKLG